MIWLGELCAALAPLCWSIAVLMYRKAGESSSPAAMTLFKNALAAVLLLATMAALGTGFPADRSTLDWARLAASGILGLFVADTLFFYALRRIGAARVAIVDTVYAPAVVGLSWLALGETLQGTFLLGAALVVGGVLLANAKRGARPVEGADVVVGTLFGLGAILGTGVGVVLAKPVLEGADLVEVTTTRMACGVAAQLVWSLVRRDRAVFSAFRPARGDWGWLLGGTLLGTYVAMLLWMGGFKWAPASVAAVLNQLATVYILVLARTVLHEPVAKRQVAGGSLAAVGALVIVLGK